ncbi:MAG: extracellular solute-binding protein [Sphaerochaetaceae bacterium]|nr:extracellular solute-binding protein [Sphaerochaetaceae bacterium]
MKKITAVFLIACLVLATVFAGGSSEAASSGKRKLTIAAESWEINKIFLEQAIESFKTAHPDVDVELVTLADQTVLGNYILDWSKGNTEVDLVFLDGGVYSSEYAAKGLIYDFEKDLNFFKDFPKTNFQPGTLDTGLIKGTQFCLPAIYEVYAISINKKMFKEAGLVDAKGEPLPIKTWDDFYDFAEKLTKKDAMGTVTQVGGSVQFGNNLNGILGCACIAEFGNPYEADGVTFKVNNPQMKRMIELWQKGIQNGYLSQATFVDNAGGRNGFKAGQIAMCYEAAGRWMEALQTVGAENLALMAVPGKDGGTYCFGCQMVIPKASKSADLACQFIKEGVYGEYSQTHAFTEYGKMAVISKYFKKALDETPLWKSIETSMNKARILYTYEESQKFLTGLDTIFQKGLVDPKTSADLIVNQILDLTASVRK